MKASDVLNPDGTGLDPFLQAVIGQDSRGEDVTVLSALARQGLDPWAEGTALVQLGHDAAFGRIDSRLGLVNDVAALAADRAAVARRLLGLLPRARAAPVAAAVQGAVQGAVARTPLRHPGLILAIVILVAFIIPLFFGVAVDTSP